MGVKRTMTLPDNAVEVGRSYKVVYNDQTIVYLGERKKDAYHAFLAPAVEGFPVLKDALWVEVAYTVQGTLGIQRLQKEIVASWGLPNEPK